MPPQLASLLAWGIVFYLFRRDLRETQQATRAVWIPTIWVLILTTRAVTSWLSLFGINVGGSSLEEGSPVDALVFVVLIFAGLRVLWQRRVTLGAVVRNNQWLAIYLIFCLVAISWSDFPFVAFKRWFKNLGHPIMVLILLTEPNFTEALTRLLKRCAFVIVPISILFIKYYPEWGRGFSTWSGVGYNTGITEGKNALGADLLILSFFFTWHLLRTLRWPPGKARRNELILCLSFLAMIGWLFTVSDSKTPLVSLTVALAVFTLIGLGWVNKRVVGIYILAGLLAIGAAEMMFGVYEATLKLLGRDASLTERTPLWAELRKWGDQKPFLGVGFESFWLGDRKNTVWRILKWNANQAHNGYLETYINMGLVGLCLLVCLIIATYRKAHRALLDDFWLGRFRYAFLFAILVYNWTEASLYGLHGIFFMFFLISMDYPRPQLSEAAEVPEPEGDDRLTQLRPAGVGNSFPSPGVPA